jgi:cob(I)alamin adenosyltransferase
MKIYTRTGDDGTTSLSGGKRVSKFHIRVEAYGSVDELIAWIGTIRSYPENNSKKDFLVHIQDQLMRCAAELSSAGENRKGRSYLPDQEIVSKLEIEIDEMEKLLPPLTNFILPGGNIAASNTNVARCVCRRAERKVLKLNETEKVPQIILQFLNRLSDYLFVLTRSISQETGNEDIKWTI